MNEFYGDHKPDPEQGCGMMIIAMAILIGLTIFALIVWEILSYVQPNL